MQYATPPVTDTCLVLSNSAPPDHAAVSPPQVGPTKRQDINVTGHHYQTCHLTVLWLGSALVVCNARLLLFRGVLGFPTWFPACLQCPRLKAIQVLGAGVDSLLSDASAPRHIPLLRVIDPLMAERMATWIMWGVINAQVWTSGHVQVVVVIASCCQCGNHQLSVMLAGSVEAVQCSPSW